MKIIHIIMPDELDTKLMRIYYDERGRRPEYAGTMSYEDWRHDYILRILGDVVGRETQRLAEEAETIRKLKET
jgi:hypothetical protein